MVINGDCCCFSGAKRGEWWNDHPIPPFPTKDGTENFRSNDPIMDKNEISQRDNGRGGII